MDEPVQSLSAPVRVWLTRVYHSKANSRQAEWGNTKGDAFLDKLHQGRKVKAGVQSKRIVFRKVSLAHGGQRPVG